MVEHSFNPEHIIELAEELRLAGFDIGTQQHIAAQDLLIALAAHNRLPPDPRDWRSLLAPIFCASPTEQEEFYGRFDLWLRRPLQLTSIPSDLPGPPPREINLPATWLHWLRKPMGIAATVFLFLLAGLAVFLVSKTNRTLTGQVFSSDGDKHVLGAQVEFFNQSAKTDGDGKFIINYQPRNWFRIFNRQVAVLAVKHEEYEPVQPIKLDVHQPSYQTIKLKKHPPGTTIRVFPREGKPSISLPPGFNVPETEEGVLLKTIRWYHWLFVVSPLVLFAAWLLLRWRRRRALMQKLQATGSPNLRRLTVRGASEHLFQSQKFRRAVQELRRPRRIEVGELDIPATINATSRCGGMFQPKYCARKSLREYLLLIDRASPADQQARFADELSQRLEKGGVIVDRFYFQYDPRTCRQRKANSSNVTLLDLVARYPNHQLLIFSDGAGFVSPLTGAAEHWVKMFSHWPSRTLLTPEASSQFSYRESTLTEHGFLVLPADDDGVNALTEAINAVELSNLKNRQEHNAGANAFPRLILERPKRWLERDEPRPKELNELCDQLRAYLGEDGWYWLAACAMYPALSWDVTLYLGYNLFGRVSSPTVKEGLDREAAALADARATDTAFEDRLLRLIRLPWFRYGSMPDWLRLRLIESFTPEQEAEVRQTIEGMLLSALEHPQEGIPLEIAERESAEPGNRLQRMKARWHAWRQRKKLADFIEHEPEESPLKDFVFLGFLSGGRARRLTVKLPEMLNRVLFPQGQAVLGLRPVTVGAATVVMIGILMVALWPKSGELLVTNSPTPTETPGPTDPLMPNLVGLYMQEAERRLFEIAPNVQLVKKELEQFTSNYGAGVVTEQMPDAGTVLNSEGSVALLYNPQKVTSPTPGVILVTVPDLRGRTFAQANEVLTRAQLKAAAVVNEQININNYNVTGQRPLPGTSLAIGGTVYLAVEPPKSPYPKMPNVIGQQFQTAESMVRERQPNARISSTESPRHNPDYIVGAVISQFPKAGSDLKPGDEVRLLYNPQQVPRSVRMPDFTGFDYVTAERRVISLVPNIQVRKGVARSHNPNYRVDLVVNQMPPAGEVLAAGGQVILYINPSPLPRMPDLVGMDIRSAQAKLSGDAPNYPQRSIEESEFNPRFKPGVVVNQSPRAGMALQPRGVAVLYYNPQLTKVRVPDVLNQQQSNAEKVLAKAQLAVGQVTKRGSPRVPGLVLDQNPRAGTMVNIGSQVGLVIAMTEDAVVPDLRNRARSAAEQLIANARLTIGQVTTQKSPLAAGTVLSQSPPAGTRVGVGSRVNLVIAVP